jgi:hypothetical protein
MSAAEGKSKDRNVNDMELFVRLMIRFARISKMPKTVSQIFVKPHKQQTPRRNIDGELKRYRLGTFSEISEGNL